MRGRYGAHGVEGALPVDVAQEGVDLAWVGVGRRGDLQWISPMSPLYLPYISPLCASMRIGCARGHLGTVLVEKRRW